MKRDPDYLHFRPYRAIVASPLKRGRRRATDENSAPLSLAVQEPRAARSRWRYAALIILVIGLGLLWRSSLLHLSPFLTKYGGSAWWSLMVFFGCGFLLPRASIGSAALLALAFSCAIEFSQLYRAEWIDQLRATRLGALVLGSTFNWPDFAGYAVGILIGAVLEKVVRRAGHEVRRW